MTGETGEIIVYSPAQAGEQDAEADEKDSRGQREKLKEAAQVASLWNDGDDGYASVPVDEHVEHFAIRSTQFRRWLIHQYYLRYKDAPGRQQVDEALGLLEARAIFEGEKHQPSHRVTGADDTIWIDLGDAEWRAIEIQSTGWDVVRNPPVKFIRRQGMRSLPEPDHHGNIGDLKRFLNLSVEHFMLAVSWLIGSLRPRGPYPILAISGEQGGGKSTACRVFRRLVDPHAVEINTPPGSQRDLVAAAKHNWVVSLDNISAISDWLSDSLCRISTGGGLGGRRLYTDDDAATFDAQRPILMNGIPHLAERPDLADRVLTLSVQEIPDRARRDEESYWGDFEKAKAGILGGLCDVLSAALARFPSTKLDRVPRMADFARWMVAAEPALGWKDGDFLRVYELNRADAVRASIEADVVAVSIQHFATETEWVGTAAELLSELHRRQPETALPPKGWPKQPNHLANRLRRVAPDLRKIGVDVRELGRQGKDRKVRWRIMLS